MLKPILFSVIALGFIASPTFGAKIPANSKKIEEADTIDASLAELNALIHDSRLAPKKNGESKPAELEDFKESLELSENKATLTTDDLAKKGGLQEMPPAILAPETELE